MIEAIEKLYGYHIWAMDKIFLELETISEEEFTKDLVDGISLRDKICHIIAADTIWLDRIEKLETKFLDSSFFPTISKTKEYFLSVKTRLEKLFHHLDETYISSKVNFKNKKGEEVAFKLFEVLFHIFNHGTYHRGQIAILIRKIKGKPPVTDIIEYFKNA